MAANFYLSTHAWVSPHSKHTNLSLRAPADRSPSPLSNHHLHPRSALAVARLDDLKYATEEELAWIEIWSGSGKRHNHLDRFRDSA